MAYKSELEALILGALRDESRHGYGIAQVIRADSEGLLKLVDNQIYPILHRLEQEGFVEAEWQPQGNKPPRKVYSLTDKGKQKLEQHRENWKEYASAFGTILGLKELRNA